MQIMDHGVQKDLIKRMKDAIDEFFKLPIEEKETYAMLSNDIQGYGQAYVVSEEQTLDWGDALILFIYPDRYRNLRFWPKTPHVLKYVFFTF